MIQYVEKLFEETKTIILPGLGALTITNLDTKEMMFMPYLKHDDGALAGFIAKDAGISEEEAKKMVSDEVHRMLNEIEGGKSVPFGNFGSFGKDADGDMIFENAEDNAESSEPAAAPLVDTAKEDADKKAKEDADAKKAAEAEAKKKAKEEADAKKAAEAEAKKKAKEEADAKKAADAEAKKKAKEEADAKKAAEAEAKKKAKEEADAKKAAEAEAKKKAKEEADAKKAAEAEAKKKAEETKKSSPKVAPVPTPPKAEKPKETPKAEAPKPTEKLKEAASKSTVNQVIPDLDNKKDAPKSETKKATTTSTAAAAGAASAKVTPEKNILQKEEIAANQQKLDKLKKDKKEKPKKKRKKRSAGFYILIGLVFIIVAGGTFVALNYEQAKEYLPFLADSTAAEPSEDDENSVLNEPDEEPADEQETASDETDEDEMADEADEPADLEEGQEEDPQEEIQEAPADPEPEPTQKPITGSNDQPYHIVAGVFGEAANAERLASKIQGMGYPAKTFQRGDKTVVSVQSYASSAEAQAALLSVSDAAPKGWVLHWP
ncbi:MAG: hypothetical protein DCO96_07990 [Fluviicola sp. XM-24bin1]|nr:MAG: hypothetical protein DCO96_07990 [Fluviicola sp. XM-24bin1]